MVTPIWGTDYIDRWLGFSFASLRGPGNIPYLNEHCDFELAIITKAEDAAYLQANPHFNNIISGIAVRLILMDEFFPPQGQVPYGIPLTLAHAKGIADLGEAAVGTYVILMNADCVLASGSFRTLVARIQEGCTIIVGQSLRAVDGDARASLLSRVDDASGVLHIAPRELMRLANAYLHSTVTARIINEPGIVGANYYHEIFWRISDTCLAMRAFMLHPICFRIDRAMDKVVCPLDYGLLTELCPDGRFCVLDDSDDFLIVELQARDSESHLLRVAPRDDSPEQRRLRLAREIAAGAASWTTREHRRAATRTVYYHSGDLPADVARRAAPFEAFVDDILAGLPPPVSHEGHPHWLPAVGDYRERMRRGGGDPDVALLDDPRNIMPDHVVAQTDAVGAVPRTAARPRLVDWATHMLDAVRQSTWRPPVKLREQRERAARLVQSRGHLRVAIEALLPTGPGAIEAVYMGGVADLAPELLDRAGRLTHVPNPGTSGTLRIPDKGILIIYAAPDLLWSWTHLEEDLDRFLAASHQVIIVLIADPAHPVAFANQSYLLSILATTLRQGKYVSRLEVISFPEPVSRTQPRQVAKPVVWNGRGEPPPDFSALIVFVEKAPPGPGGKASAA